MTAIYLVFTILSLFTCMLPAGVLSVIWEPLSDNLTVGVPYIAILRVLITAGVIAAVVLSDRIRAYAMIRDIVIGAAALETLALLGFSMSRVFWNLCVWSFCLGFGLGMGVSLLVRMVRWAGRQYSQLIFAGGSAGIAAGVWILSRVLARGVGWRTSCQILAVAQVLLCLVQFSLRRRGRRDSGELLRKMERERNRVRSGRRQEKIRSDGEVDERFAPFYFHRIVFCYLACVLCGILILGMMLWPDTYLIAAGKSALSSVSSVILTAGGLTAGRLLAHLIRVPDKMKRLLSGMLTVLACGIAAVLVHARASAVQLQILQFAVGAAAGPVFPGLILTEDERLDEEAQDSLLGLMTAFYFGGWALITPLTQALVGSSQENMFALWLLAAAAVMTVCLALAGKRVKR